MRIKKVKVFVIIYLLTCIYIIIFNHQSLYENLFTTTDISYLTDTIMKDYKSFYSYYDNGGEEKVYTLYDEMPVAKRIALLEVRTGYVHENGINHSVRWYKKNIKKRGVTNEMVMEEVKNILNDYKIEIFSHKIKIGLVIMVYCLVITTLIYYSYMKSKDYREIKNF